MGQFVLGLGALIAPIGVAGRAMRFAVLFLVLVSLRLSVFNCSGMRVQRIEGAVLVALYLVFVIGVAWLGT